MASTAPQASWYDDPNDPTLLRWWDGSEWTDHVVPREAAEPEPEVAPEAMPEVVPEPTVEPAPEQVVAPRRALDWEERYPTSPSAPSVSRRRVRPGFVIALVLILLLGAAAVGAVLTGVLPIA